MKAIRYALTFPARIALVAAFVPVYAVSTIADPEWTVSGLCGDAMDFLIRCGEKLQQFTEWT